MPPPRLAAAQTPPRLAAMKAHPPQQAAAPSPFQSRIAQGRQRALTYICRRRGGAPRPPAPFLFLYLAGCGPGQSSLAGGGVELLVLPAFSPLPRLRWRRLRAEFSGWRRVGASQPVRSWPSLASSNPAGCGPGRSSPAPRAGAGRSSPVSAHVLHFH